MSIPTLGSDSLPPGWHKVEKTYTEASALAGQTYIRFASDDKVHNCISTLKQVFQRDGKDKGYDWEEVWTQVEAKRKAKAAEAKAESARILQERKDRRESMIESFRKQCDGYTMEGHVLMHFKGMKTRCSFMKDCQQVHTHYSADNGDTWFQTLKDAEAWLGEQIELGKLQEVKQMVENAREVADSQLLTDFRKRAADNHESGPIAEIVVPLAEGESSSLVVKEKQHRHKGEKRHGTKRPAQDLKYESHPTFTVRHVGPPFDADDGDAIRFSQMLRDREFPESTKLLQVECAEADVEQIHHLEKALCGLYHARGGAHNGRPLYQRLHELDPKTLVAGRAQLHWDRDATPSGRWQLGALTFPCAAYSESDVDDPTKAAGWHILSPKAKAVKVEQEPEQTPQRSPEKT